MQPDLFEAEKRKSIRETMVDIHGEEVKKSIAQMVEDAQQHLNRRIGQMVRRSRERIEKEI